MPLDLSILIATYNRAEILRRTLSNMAKVERHGLAVEFVVIDNNSSDNTGEVIEAFKDILPIRHLFEPRPGKNCALNKALNEATLGQLVVFTDDDVKPNLDWFKQITEVASHWPRVSVFGGRIYPIWPDSPPDWLTKLPDEYRTMSYAIHDCGDDEQYYGEGTKLKYPFGPNFWIRNSIVNRGYRFDESVGPSPDSKSRIMGGETSFLMELGCNGYKMIYTPATVVGHYVTRSQMTKEYLIRRIATFAKSLVYLSDDFKLKSLYENNQRLWLWRRYCSLGKHTVRKYLSFLSINRDDSFQRRIDAEFWIVHNIFYIKNHKQLFKKCRKSV